MREEGCFKKRERVERVRVFKRGEGSSKERKGGVPKEKGGCSKEEGKGGSKRRSFTRL